MAAGAFSGLCVQAEADPYPSLTARQAAIRDAAVISDPAERERRLRIAIRAGLLREAGDPLSPAFSYLVANERWLNPLPYVDIILEFDAADHEQWHRALSFLDDAELARSSRARRIEVYGAAISKGDAVLPRGSRVIRTIAIGAAAADGLQELQPLIEAYYGVQDEGSQRTHPLAELREQLRLRAGAANREEAGKLAAESLAAIPDASLEARIQEEESLAKIVLDLVDYVCAANPFTRERNDGCTNMRDIYRRQLVLRESVRQGGAISHQAIQTATGPSESWLENLAGHLGEPDPSWARRAK